MKALLDQAEGARAVLIAGPTASGKSSAALRVADRAGRAGRAAHIINADSMQVYDTLRVLTARPGPDEEDRAPHRLYGHVPVSIRYSAGAWLREVKAALGEADRLGALPIIVGGTGMYFKALTEGLAAVPVIPSEVRAAWAERLAGEGPARLHALLAERDPASAATLRPTDPQRIVRALEVLDATGRPLREWQARQSMPVLAGDEAYRIVLEPDRPVLYARIGERFDRMVEGGALDEVRALLDRQLPPELPAMKALGVKAIQRFLSGQIGRDEAVESAKMETRRYAKRQTTWFRNQMPDWNRIGA